jgi:phosphoglycolate phosphatase
MKKGILFDLDGTLWDSSKSVVDSWNEKLKEVPDIDYTMSYEQMKGYMGQTMEEIAYSFFNTVSKERALEILQLCMDYENEYIEEHGGILFEGLEETLAKLHETYFLAIVSNCQQGYIEAFLKHHKLERYFDDTENYGRTMQGKSYNIKLLVERNHLEKAVYVGDIMGDYNATMEAGLPFIHAAYGFGTVPEGTPRITDIRQLPEKAKEVLG